MEDLDQWLAKAVVYFTAFEYAIRGIKKFLKWLQPEIPKSPKTKQQRGKRKAKKS